MLTPRFFLKLALLTLSTMILTGCGTSAATPTAVPSAAEPIAFVPTATNAPPTAAPVPAVTVSSTLDGMTTLPHRIQWEARPVLPAGQLLSGVNFLIDGQLAWIEHHPPYDYGGDGNYLVTTFLTPGEHTFTTRVVTLKGQHADSTVKASVAAAAPPDDLANTSWTRYQTAAEIAESTSGQPGQPGQIAIMINSVGWWFGGFGSPLADAAIIDVEYPSKGVVRLQTIIEEPPFPDPNGGAFCEVPDPPIDYSYSLSNGGKTLTLHPMSKDPCGDRLGAMEGTWTRTSK